MTDLGDPPIPVIEFVTVRRVKAGIEVDAELTVRLQPAHGPLRPSLSIGADWRTGTREFKRFDFYGVEEVPSPLGRAFHLHRTEEAIAKDFQHVPSYWVLVGPETRCDCRGMAGTERANRLCKHAAALSHLVTVGAI